MSRIVDESNRRIELTRWIRSEGGMKIQTNRKIRGSRWNAKEILKSNDRKFVERDST